MSVRMNRISDGRGFAYFFFCMSILLWSMPACGSAAGFGFDAGFGFCFDAVFAFADAGRDFVDAGFLAAGTARPASRINRRRVESDWILARMAGSASIRA